MNGSVKNRRMRKVVVGPGRAWSLALLALLATVSLSGGEEPLPRRITDPRSSEHSRPANLFRLPPANTAGDALRPGISSAPTIQQTVAPGAASLDVSDQFVFPERLPTLGPATNLSSEVQLCQGYVPASPFPINAVECWTSGTSGDPHWNAHQPIPWESFAQGEYVGPSRTQHVPEYRLRVDDVIEFAYRLTGLVTPDAYALNVSDVIDIESLTAEELNRQLTVQPDGTITVPMLGQVRAAGLSVEELRVNLEEQYRGRINDPSITVTPVQFNSTLEELRATVDARAGRGGQSREARVTPEGTIQLPAIGSVSVQGLTLDELKREIDRRYGQLVSGIEVTPILAARAPRFVFVVGEVRVPGRYVLEGPTTVMQSVAMAGGWTVGGDLREIVVFRRAEDWRLIATKLDLRGAFLGRQPSPADEIWLRDSDIVIIPKTNVLLADNFIELVFTRGLYGVIPLQTSINFSKLSTL